MFKRILHPTDFSAAAFQAFNQSVALARRWDARLQLLHVVVPREDDKSIIDKDKSIIDKDLPDLNEATDSLSAESKIRLEEMVARSDIAGDMCSIVSGRGVDAGQVIIEEAKLSGADLIVMGTHGRSPVLHLFLGSVSEEVVRYAPCPIMVLGRQDIAPGKLENILLPVELSKASHQTVGMALALAKSHEARLHVLRVHEGFVPSVYEIDSENAFTYDPTLHGRGKEALGKFLAKHDTTGVELVLHLVEGRVSRSILDLSKQEQVDLIVMDTAGLKGIHRFVLGSVTEKVLRKAKMPVLTMRTVVESDSVRPGPEKTTVEVSP